MDSVFDDVQLASGDTETANRYLDDLQDKIESMANKPKTGTLLYYEEMFTGYYYVRFKEYLAFYRLDGDNMKVDRVLPRRQDYMRILFHTSPNVVNEDDEG